MSVHILEIRGEAIVALGAESQIEAEQIVEEDFFRSDLMSLETEGKPLWNGIDELFLRDPYPEEFAAFQSAVQKAGAEIDDYVLFLVPVTDPSDDLLEEK
ncbi:hypothetical protein KFK14_19655 [Sphingobium phenoxybenzoativorans]|uniref:Uncharacterized protein n=1 Tax=Sphingobium phenoxybenzoativorans TaxID=1592790 RepID=A0A975Q1B0_9SPHN|nr:hypothetical protein [Sphingobium phenoxybenzoativorans]QUT05188.1 hypothetical protein KFK14_19655 [Sphingobium phenoxybenzoativorans]